MYLKVNPTQAPKSGVLFACPLNRSVKVAGTCTDNLSSDGGDILARLPFFTTGVVTRLATCLAIFRDPNRKTDSFQALLRPFLLLQVQGWGQEGNFARLRQETFAVEHLLHQSGGKRRAVVVFDVDGCR